MQNIVAKYHKFSFSKTASLILAKLDMKYILKFISAWFPYLVSDPEWDSKSPRRVLSLKISEPLELKNSMHLSDLHKIIFLVIWLKSEAFVLLNAPPPL